MVAAMKYKSTSSGAGKKDKPRAPDAVQGAPPPAFGAASCACGGGCPRCRARSLGEHAPPIVNNALHSPGAPLDRDVQTQMEMRFGRSLNHVRLHTDRQAAQSARAVDAVAYTVGSHIAFDSGRYAPDTAVGRRTLAHELAHVLQQQDARPSGALKLGVSGSGAEHEADRAADAVIAGRQAPALQSRYAPYVARQDTPGRARNAQLRCVARLGGCAYYRSGGLPTPPEIVSYNNTCRGETGYAGADITPTNDECSILQHGLFTVHHRDGSNHAVPGIPANASDFSATGAAIAPGTRRADHPITGGFTESVSLLAGFGTGAQATPTADIDALISAAGSRIPPTLVSVVRAVAADLYLYRVLHSYFTRDNGRLGVGYGHYNAQNPPTTTIGVDGDGNAETPFEARRTLMHEMLHYALDRLDASVGEARDPSGADHHLISALEARYVMIALIRSGQAPFHQNIESFFGRFLTNGDRYAEIRRAVSTNNPALLRGTVNQTDFVTTAVASGLLSAASSLRLPASMGAYSYTGPQFQDLAYVSAQNAVIMRRAMLAAADIAQRRGVALSAVFALPEWRAAMETFIGRYVGALERFPDDGAVGASSGL
jgi:hypothetical protein